jgi:hypothetical protein
MGRVLLLDASKGELTDLIQFSKSGGTAKSRRGLAAENEGASKKPPEGPIGRSIEPKDVHPDKSASNGRKVLP